MTGGRRREAAISADRWRVLEPLLDDALDEAPERRQRFLEDACGDDSALLHELLTLLRTVDTPHAELDEGVGALVPDLLQTVAPRALDIPDVLADRYRIVRELGQGGMSVVFLADDLRLGRRVAIKVLRRDVRPGNGGDRFGDEIRLTAGLRHRNIVPLFESGEAEGWTFFVMPYIDGETVMQRLARTGAPGHALAVGIAIDIASALSHAHAAGVVHRDVKPSNIMLSDGQALLMDFGIARAPADTARHFTAPGCTVGTPAYMSPEQCLGDASIGPASDIYSLGGVLYEMLTGQPPVSAAVRIFDAASVIAPSRAQRIPHAVIPASLRAVVDRAMHIDAAARYESAAELADALADVLARGFAQVPAGADGPSRMLEPVSAPPARPASFLTRAGSTAARTGADVRHRFVTARWISSTLVLLMAVAGIAIAARTSQLRFGSARAVSARTAIGDSSRILLLPVVYDPALAQHGAAHDPMREALLRWTGITVVDVASAREVLPASIDSGGALTAATAGTAAVRTGAGRYLRRELSQRGTQMYGHASLYETGTDRVVSEASVNFGAGIDTADAGFRELADQILLADVPGGLRSGAFVGTRSRAALQLFARGVGAVDRWDLALADSALDEATRRDAEFARAELWLAQVRAWREQPQDAWTYLVNRAGTRRNSLMPRDQQALDALRAHAAGDTRRACGLWERLATREATDFSAWYGAAMCAFEDHVVVRDAHSPSGWRFRSSYQHASLAFQRAFQILPAVHREFRTSWFSGLDERVFTSPTQLRYGLPLPPDTGVLLAYPSWDELGDSLTFVPFRQGDFSAKHPWTYPPSHRDALRHQRELMRRITTTWRAAFPASADAMLAVAMSCDKLGDASALDSARVAQRLAVTADERLRVAIAEVWLQVKYGIPDDVTALASARAMADSLLRVNPHPPGEMVEAMASLAMLVGDVTRAVELARAGVERVDDSTPAALKQLATTLQILASSGSMSDSIGQLEDALSAGIGRTVLTVHQAEVRERLIGRAAVLAYPGHLSPMIATLARAGDALSIAQVSWARRDVGDVRRRLDQMAIDRRALPPEFIKLETLLPEAELLAAAGDAAGALARLAPTLDAQQVSALETLRTPIGAAMLVRSMGLRALLAARLGDRIVAARWARAFLALWSNADPGLQPQVRRVAALVGS